VLAVAVFAVQTFVLDPQNDAAERDAARLEGRSDAFEYLDLQRESDPGLLRVVANSPLYEKFEGDPSWLPFLERAGLAPQQLGAVEFNPRLPPELLTHPEKKP